MNQQAGEVIESLKEFINHSVSTPRLLLGIVTTQNSGPPPTITATVHGQDVPSIRYIGAAPSAGQIVVILADGPFYVSIGVLT